MPSFFPKTKIEFDPEKWPSEKVRHMRDEQIPPLPPGIWEKYVAAVPKLQGLKRKVEQYEAWFADLTEFGLRKWKLVGHGSQPDSLLHPGETRVEGRRIASMFELDEFTDNVLDDYPEWGR